VRLIALDVELYNRILVGEFCYNSGFAFVTITLRENALKNRKLAPLAIEGSFAFFSSVIALAILGNSDPKPFPSL